MKGACTDCPEQANDLGGCRCQAYMLTGDPAATDPVCAKSAERPLIDAILARSEAVDPAAIVARPLVFRDPKASRSLGADPDGSFTPPASPDARPTEPVPS